MKIFAVIRNYDEPQSQSLFGSGPWGVYELSESTVLRSGNPFFVPDFDCEFRAFPSIAFRIGRLGKSIAPRFAGRYLEAWTMAFTVVAVTRLKELREDGMPWTQAVSFDRSCMLGNLQPIDTLTNCGEIEIIHSGDGCGHRVAYDLNRFGTGIAELVSALSSTNTLKNGDLILAALTPQGIELKPGMHLEAKYETSETNLIDINIK